MTNARTGWTGGRIAAVITGGFLALCSLGLIGIGGVAIGESTSDGGFVDLGHANYRSKGYAVTSDSYDWSTAAPMVAPVDKVRIQVTPASKAPVIVGLAKPEDLDRYLRGVAHTTTRSGTNYRPVFTEHQGSAPATAPTSAGIWTAKVSGTGPQTLEFLAKDQPGDRILVAMNANGTPLVEGKVESAATMPLLPWVGTGVLAAGLAVGVGATMLIVRPVRRARQAA